MEKRAIIAIILTFAVIMLWGVIQSKFFPAPPAKPPEEVKKEKVLPLEEKKAIEAAKPIPEKAAAQKVFPEKEVSVETPYYKAVFTTRDARLKHFKLKKYEDRIEESSMTIKLTGLVRNILGEKPKVPEKPKPLDLVNTTEEEGLPLGLVSASRDLSLPDGNWEVNREELRLAADGEKGEVTFSKRLEDGLIITKKYKFGDQAYAVDLDVEVQNGTSKEITGQLGLEWVGRIELEKLADTEIKDYGLKYAFLKNEKVERKDLGGTSSSGCTPGCSSPKRTIEPFEVSDKGLIRWFSFGGEYFSSLMSLPEAKESLLTVKGDGKNLLKANFVAPQFSVSSRETVKIPFRVYLGPKDEKQLKSLGVAADKLIDYGFFTVVAKPLLWFLDFTHKATKNYGIDILVLSILIKIIFLPLTQISFKSMKEMQKIQPEMQRLKEVYKNDKARQQQEIMLLYKRRKINPMSGCLPMLIQIPVFIALYNALQNAIEMRHAPFFLWIKDLSAKDPIYITPLIMGATMVLQQKMTPTAADPAQAKMFMLMPVMFTFLFLNFPSGLVLYWLVNNVLSIAHQYYLNKKT